VTHGGRVGVNIVANAFGTGAAVLFALVFVPIYLRHLGPEAYGLVGVFTALLALFATLDMGLSTTLNRELARLTGREETSAAAEARHLTRTLEVMYWLVALCIGGAIYALASPIAWHWVNVEELPAETVIEAICLMGVIVASQWPQALYGGGLLGLERQVTFNSIKVVMSVVRGGGAALVVMYVSPTIRAFLLWQLAVASLHTTLLGIALWRALPRTSCRARVRPRLLRTRWRFAAGVTGITVTVTILTQLDKVLLTGLLSMEAFGYYAFAATAGTAMGYVAQPFFQALFPRFSQLCGEGKERALSRSYHAACQLVSVAVLPLAGCLILFAPEILRLPTLFSWPPGGHAFP
jgi:O-antigen/teichoic acid export membrane protein